MLRELKKLPSYLCPPILFLPTLLHSIVSPLIIHATPLILRHNFSIDAVHTPFTHSIATFTSQALELFVKLPLETVLRRGQMAVLTSPQYTAAMHPPSSSSEGLKTVVPIGPYRGVAGTLWYIAREEGESSAGDTIDALKTGRNPVTKRGQGLEGLWRGWRVGMWGLAGMWGAAAMQGLGNGGGEF
jgi:fusion and transport protein UGO1